MTNTKYKQKHKQSKDKQSKDKQSKDQHNHASKTIAKGAFYVFIGMVISKLLSYIYRMIVARIGTEEYGLISLALAVTGIVSFISLLGLDEGVLRYVSYYLGKKQINKIRALIINSLRISVIFSVIMAGIVYIFSNEISIYFFKNSNLIPILKILALTIPLLVISNVFLAAIRAIKDAKSFSFTKNINENFVKVLFTLILLFFGLGVIGAAIGYVVAIASTAIISFYIIKNKLLDPISKKSKKDLKSIKSNKTQTHFKIKDFRMNPILSYSFPLMMCTLITQVMVWTATLIMGYFRTEAEVGIYNAALPTATLISIIPGGIVVLFLPVMTELLAKKDFASFKKTFKTSINWVFVFNLPLVLIIIIFARQIIKILFGSEYIPGYIPLIILAASYFIYHIFNISAQTLKVLKKSKHLMINLAIAAVVNIILSYWLIPRTDSFGGIVGGAISTSVSLLIYGFLCGIQSYYFTKISPFQIKQIKTIFVGAVTFTIVYYLFTMIDQRTVFNLSALFILFLFLYVSFILIFRCLNKEDYEILKDVKNRIKSLLKF